MSRAVLFCSFSLLAACSASGGDAPAGPGGGGGAGPGSGGAIASAGGFTASATGGDPGLFTGIGGTNVMVAPGAACASAAYKGDLLPSSILFIVDRSGSMNCNLPPITASVACEQNPVAVDPSQPTKWSVISGTMSAALDQLAKVPNTSVGLTFFSVDDVCGVTSAPNVEVKPLSVPQVDALKNALANAKPAGGTPIVGATILGYKHLHQQAQAPGNRFIVLVTDGSDSCIDTGAPPTHANYTTAGITGDVVSRLLNTEIPNAMKVNIRTFVIGAPGSEQSRSFLSKIAFVGGTANTPTCDYQAADPKPGAECHFDMTRSSDFAKDLTDALQRITGKAAIACEYAVPSAGDGGVVDKNKVNVDYYKGGDTANAASKVELGNVPDATKPCAAGVNGWQYNDDKSKIRLCADVCDQVRKDAKAAVVVSLGCPVRIIM
jgi:hypothetical protein